MALALKIEADREQLDAVARGLADDGRRIRRVLARTINDVVRRGRTVASRELRQLAPLKKKLVDKHISLALAGGKNLAGGVRVSGRGPISLTAFKPRKTKGGPTTVEVRKGSRQPAQQVGRTRAGTAASAEPAFGTHIDKLRKGVFQRVGRGRLPIQRLFGPSVHELFEEAQLAEPVAEAMGDYFDERLDQRLKLELDLS